MLCHLSLCDGLAVQVAINEPHVHVQPMRSMHGRDCVNRVAVKNNELTVNMSGYIVFVEHIHESVTVELIVRMSIFTFQSTSFCLISWIHCNRFKSCCQELFWIFWIFFWFVHSSGFVLLLYIEYYTCLPLSTLFFKFFWLFWIVANCTIEAGPDCTICTKGGCLVFPVVSVAETHCVPGVYFREKILPNR